MAYGPHTDILLKGIAQCKDKWYEIWKSDILFIWGLNITRLPVLPKYIKKLLCSYSTIQELPELPEGLESLIVNDTYLKILPELPKSLKLLSCAFMRNKIKWPTLPEGLEHLRCDTHPWKYEFDISDIEWTPDILPLLPKSLNLLVCDIYRKEGETMEAYIERIREWQEQSQEQSRSKQRTQERCRIIKEDLMKTVWHPRRVEKWLEAGGFELLEAL
jgi:hypothetical protein